MTYLLFFIFSAQEEYELLLEDEVEFIQALQMPGSKDNKIKRESSPTPALKKLTTIEETKKSLPIYPFRNDLLEAIRDHQVRR